MVWLWFLFILSFMTLFNDTSNIGSIFMSFLLVQARDFMSCSATQNLHGNFLSLATLLNFELQTRLVNYVKANVHTWEVNISFFLEENLKFKFLVWNSKTWPRKCGHWIWPERDWWDCFSTLFDTCFLFSWTSYNSYLFLRAHILREDEWREKREHFSR